MPDGLESEDSWLDDFKEEVDDELGEAPPGFLLDELLGRGGMAEVYLAHRTGPKGFSRKVVIKRIRPDKIHDHDFVERFIREASLTSRFHHPNIVEILELVTLDDTYFIVMEYLNGRPINHLVDELTKKHETFPQALAAYTVAGLASAIDYAHNFIDEEGKLHQIIHRDISPDNVFVTYAGQVKLLDFGVAKDLDGTQMTQGDQVIGKPLYLPPESLAGEPASPARDVYSLGMTLYVMLAGRAPFEMSSGPEGLAKLLMDITGGAKPPPPSTFNPDIDPNLEHIVMKAIASEPGERYSAGDLQSVLEGWLMSSPENVNQSTLAAFMREFGDPGMSSRGTTGKQKPLKALGGAKPKARGGWQANRDEGEKKKPTGTAHIPEGKFAPVEAFKPGGSQSRDEESVAKVPGQGSTLMLDSDMVQSPAVDQPTASHPSAEIDPHAMDDIGDPPIPPKAEPRKPRHSEPSPLEALEAFELESGAFEPNRKKKQKKKPKKKKPSRNNGRSREREVDRGKAMIGAAFLALVLFGAAAFAYYAINPPDDRFELDDEIEKIKASLKGHLVEETEMPTIDGDEPVDPPAEESVAQNEAPEPNEEVIPVARRNAILSVRCDGTWIYVDGSQAGSCTLGATRIRVTPGKHVVEVETMRGLLRGVVRARANRETPVRLKKPRRAAPEPEDEVVRMGE